MVIQYEQTIRLAFLEFFCLEESNEQHHLGRYSLLLKFILRYSIAHKSDLIAPVHLKLYKIFSLV